MEYMAQTADPENQALIWDFYRPRHTHAWNMLVLAWREFDDLVDDDESDFRLEYLWENLIIRLWLHRSTVRMLTKWRLSP